MELLIPGLLLVALMVYASTRIKRIAAAAFEPETVETDDFLIEKPEGFLNVINLDAGLAFRCYSKDFGTAGAEEFRAARAEARIYEGSDIGRVVAGIKETVSASSDVSEIIAGQKYEVIETETVEKGVGFRVCYKLAASRGRIIEFKTITLLETTTEIRRKIEAMLLSFTVK